MSALESSPRLADAGRSVTECERKPVGCRAALDAGTDPVVVAGWITETEARRKVEQMRLDQAIAKVPKRLTGEEIAAMATEHGDLRKLLHSADPQDKADVYEQLGLMTRPKKN
ncbi:hypothetical protein AB0F17_63575 [Nonomuraea sp. NPDC026600]|uniref:hypothetical protein n=1 Tax=Nonomuraea sp. NPDC026600 TaxID=3155363 RepID=UPI0033CDE0E3